MMMMMMMMIICIFVNRHKVVTSDQTIFITESHLSLLPTCFTSSLEPASYITQDSSSTLLIPLSATVI